LQIVRERGLATIVVLHDLNLAARYCDRILMLEDGRVRAEGPPGEALGVELVGRTYAVTAERADAADGTTQFLFRGLPSSNPQETHRRPCPTPPPPPPQRPTRIRSAGTRTGPAGPRSTTTTSSPASPSPGSGRPGPG